MLTTLTTCNVNILAVATSMAVLVVLLGLAHCFLGYVLFRIALVIDGLLGGFWLGGQIVGLFRNPRDSDLLVGGLIGAVLLAMLAWYLFRGIFALGVGGLVALLIATAFGQPASTTGWVLGILAGLIVAAICYAQMRKLVILFTAVGGAVTTTTALAILMGDLSTDWANWVAGNPLGGAMALLAVVVLTVAGVAVQNRSPFLITNRYSPEPSRSYKPGKNVRPPFAKG